MTVILLDPIAKPRMTRRDKWDKRSIVNRYWAFKDELVLECKKQNFVLPDKYTVDFCIEMPKSWSEKKKNKLDGTPHQQRPDLDNLLKAINDCLKDEDSCIYQINAAKHWSTVGKIIFHI